MMITARYASRCPVCHEEIHAGEKIDWERDRQARHPHCAVQEDAERLAVLAEVVRSYDDMGETDAERAANLRTVLADPRPMRGWAGPRLARLQHALQADAARMRGGVFRAVSIEEVEALAAYLEQAGH